MQRRSQTTKLRESLFVSGKGSHGQGVENAIMDRRIVAECSHPAVDMHNSFKLEKPTAVKGPT